MRILSGKLKYVFIPTEKNQGPPPLSPNYLLPDDDDTEFEGAICVDADGH